MTNTSTSTTNTNSPTVLVSFPHEMQAGAILNALEQHGIQAQLTGVMTSGFRAEAPGIVSVVVPSTELDQAREVLATVNLDQDEVDWSQVNTGDTSFPSNEVVQAKPYANVERLMMRSIVIGGVVMVVAAVIMYLLF